MKSSSSTSPTLSSTSANGKSQISAIATLTTFLQSRYNSEAKFLNLDNMDEDPIVKNIPGLDGIGSSHSRGKVGPVMFKLISELFPEV